MLLNINAFFVVPGKQRRLLRDCLWRHRTSWVTSAPTMMGGSSCMQALQVYGIFKYMYISRLIIYICLDICDYLYFCIMWLFIFDRRLCRLFNWSYMLLRPVEGDRKSIYIYKYMYIFIYIYIYINVRSYIKLCVFEESHVFQQAPSKLMIL